MQPGRLTVLHRRGVRRRFVGPGTLYLVSGLLFMVAFKFVMDAPLVQVDLFDFNLIIHDQTIGCPRATHLVCAGIGRVGSWLGQRWSSDDQRMTFERRVIEAFAWCACMGLPVLATAVAALYRRRRERYGDCVVLAAHLYAGGFLSATLALLVSGLAVFVVPLYVLFSLHEIFGGRWSDIVLRAAAIAVIHAGVLSMLAVGMAGASLPR